MKTLNYSNFLQADHDPALRLWLQSLEDIIEKQSSPKRHGHFPKWLEALHSLPRYTANSIELNKDIVSVDSTNNTDDAQIRSTLMALTPWRKGPFQINDIFIDSEWRSNLKWSRIEKHITPLTNGNVLDVGCGNGYYGYRMLGAGAKTVVGVDPGELFCTQFAAINHFIKTSRFNVLPLTGEMVFDDPFLFDTVFSMGVVSHRREPLEHLTGLLSCLKPGGELVLETLVIESSKAASLVPEDRYANMRNIWVLPSVGLLKDMLSQTGFRDINCIDLCRTSIEEQRSTAWMPSFSLENGLDPKDATKTVEGYPAPTRCVLIARKPESR